MSKIIILTVDGGGIKGVIPAYILNQLESDIGKSCYQLFDIMGGTSTGGIITAALTTPPPGSTNGMPLTAGEVLGIYQNDGASIFVPQGWEIDDVLYAEYYASNDGVGIEPYLQGKVGLTTLSAAKSNMQNINGRTSHVFMTSYTINSNGGTISNPVEGVDYGPYLFNWYDAALNTSDDYCVWEAARSTSAAPTYFPVADVGGGVSPNSSANQRWGVDGGVMSNDPAVWAISEAIRTGLATALSDIVMISLGTGTYPSGAGLITASQGGTVPNMGNWGTFPWLGSELYDLSGSENGSGALINIITESVQLVSDMQIRALKNAGLTYYRLEPVITQEQTQMDNIDPSNIESLINTTYQYLQGDGQATYTQVLKALQAG